MSMRVSSIRLPADLDQRLELLSFKSGRQRGFYIRKALELTLDEFERVYLHEQVQPDPARISSLRTSDS
ncbi:MAG: CopG family transcriptional regulator [Betaproteobacteria bacterium HGW-Betaproteobacteria-9]|jgi:predicted DNA-binding protein|nr:MAG: CopG family transcriptional regulator [Betaproteobacteria bacterium HGW-Betaproteobacteria-9]